MRPNVVPPPSRTVVRRARPALPGTARAVARRLVTAIAAITLVACSDGGSAPSATTVTLLPASPSIRVGETVQLVATPKDANGNVIAVSGQFAWTSSATTVATVDATGKVTGVSPGNAQITASIGQLSGSAQVTVLQPPVVRIDVAPPTVSFSRTQTRQLTASTFAANDEAVTGRAVTWATSDAAVVTVSPTSGATVTITAVAPGTAVVTATSEGVARPVAVTVEPDPVITFTPPAATFGATEGGANPAAQAVTISNTGGGILSGLSVGTITYGGQASGWLTAALEGGTTASAPLTLRATTGVLPVGTYTASVPVSSNVPGVVSRTLPVTFNIGSAIELGTTPTSVSFTAPAGSGNPPTQTVSVFSVNGSVIPGVTVGPAQYGAGASGWLTVAPSGSSTPLTVTLGATVGTLASGTYTATLPISAPTATNGPVTIAVTLVVPAPRLEVSPGSLAFTSAQGLGTAGGQAITITNGGRGSLSGISASIAYGGGPSGWLNGSFSSTTAPATLTLAPVGAVASTLARGTYSATVTISAPGVENSPRTVNVTLHLVFTFDRHIAGIVANTVAPNGCANSSCHDVGGTNPNMQITGAVGHTATDVYNRVVSRVTPGNLAASVLYQRMNGNPSPMPPAGVVAAWRDAVAAWILDGARRN